MSEQAKFKQKQKKDQTTTQDSQTKQNNAQDCQSGRYSDRRSDTYKLIKPALDHFFDNKSK